MAARLVTSLIRSCCTFNNCHTTFGVVLLRFAIVALDGHIFLLCVASQPEHIDQFKAVKKFTQAEATYTEALALSAELGPDGAVIGDWSYS